MGELNERKVGEVYRIELGRSSPILASRFARNAASGFGAAGADRSTGSTGRSFERRAVDSSRAGDRAEPSGGTRR